MANKRGCNCSSHRATLSPQKTDDIAVDERANRRNTTYLNRSCDHYKSRIRAKVNPRATLPFRTLIHSVRVRSGVSLPKPVFVPVLSASHVAVSVAETISVRRVFGDFDVGSSLGPIRVNSKLPKPPSPSPKSVVSRHSFSVTSKVSEPRPKISSQSRNA